MLGVVEERRREALGRDNLDLDVLVVAEDLEHDGLGRVLGDDALELVEGANFLAVHGHDAVAGEELALRRVARQHHADRGG